MSETGTRRSPVPGAPPLPQGEDSRPVAERPASPGGSGTPPKTAPRAGQPAYNPFPGAGGPARPAPEAHALVLDHVNAIDAEAFQISSSMPRSPASIRHITVRRCPARGRRSAPRR